MGISGMIKKYFRAKEITLVNQQPRHIVEAIEKMDITIARLQSSKAICLFKTDYLE
jgi:hypothetical protein